MHPAAAALALVLAAPLQHAGVATPAVYPPPPPLPASSGAGTSSCTAVPGTRGRWSMLHRETGAVVPSSEVVPVAVPVYLTVSPVFELRVDPWLPCRIYDAVDAQTLKRSTDGGRTWRTVLHSAATATYTAGGDPTCATPTQSCALTTQPFTLSDVDLPQPGTVLLGEQGNGDAVVGSGDAGRRWTLRDGGIEGQRVLRVVHAPSDGRVLYAMVRADTVNHALAPTVDVPPPTTASIVTSHDGGATWTLAGPPPLPPFAPLQDAAISDGLSAVDLAVDPQAPEHVWLALQTPATPAFQQAGKSRPQLALIVESRDGGQTWPSITGSFTNAQIDQVVPLATAPGAVRLLVAGWFPGHPTSVLASDDDGHTWTDTAVPDPVVAAQPTGRQPAAAIAVDPSHPRHVLVVVCENPASAYYSDDALATVRTHDLLPGTAGLRTPLAPDTEYPGVLSLVQLAVVGLNPANGRASSVVQADRYGDFYVAVTGTDQSGNPFQEYDRYTSP